MFDTVQVIMDIFGRPIFVLPVDLAPEKVCTVSLEETCIDFFVEAKKIGSVPVDEAALILLVAQQPEVGIISWDDKIKKECPANITHVAQVSDKRSIAA